LVMTISYAIGAHRMVCIPCGTRQSRRLPAKQHWAMSWSGEREKLHRRGLMIIIISLQELTPYPVSTLRGTWIPVT
jgi:hypothetical protein